MKILLVRLMLFLKMISKFSIISKSELGFKTFGDFWDESYDLEEDPSEMNNIYNDPNYAEVQKELHLRLKGLRTKYGDSDELDQMHLKRYLSSGNN